MATLISVFVIGVGVGVVLTLALLLKKDGYLTVDQTNPDIDRYSLDLEIPLDSIPNRNHIVLQVRSR